VEVVASLSQGRTAAAQCGLFTYKSVPVIFEPPCTLSYSYSFIYHRRRVILAHHNVFKSNPPLHRTQSLRRSLIRWSRNSPTFLPKPALQ